MRALVLSEEDAETYGKYLKKLPDAKLDDLWYDTYVSDCADRRASACSTLDVYKRQVLFPTIVYYTVFSS